MEVRTVSNTECSPRAAVAAVLAEQYGVIGRRQAFGAGLSPRQVQWLVESSQWIRVHEAVYRLAATRVTANSG